MGGFGNIDNGGDTYGIFGLNAAALLRLGGFDLQLGGVGETGIQLGGADTYGGAGVEAHLLRGGPGGGVFGLATAFYFDQNDDDWNVQGAVALEAGLRRNAMNFGFQAGYVGPLATEGNDRLDHAWWGRAMVGFDLGSRARLTGDVAFYRGGFDNDNDPFRAIGAGAEMAFMLGPHTALLMSVDAFWGRDILWGDNFATYTFLAGIRIGIGGGQPTADLPDFIRINAILAENS